MTKKVLILLTVTLLFITVLVSCDKKADAGESVTNINLDATQITLKPGETVTVLASVSPSDYSGSVSWYSTDTSVATVKDGVVSAVANGSVIVVCASDNGIFAKCTVTVDSGDCAHEIEWTTVTAASCTSVGSKIAVCKKEGCGMFLGQEEIPMTAHTPGRSEKQNEKAASCSVAGSYDYVVYCLVCTNEASREKVTVPKIAHTFGDWTVTKAATCTEAGKESATCSVCSFKNEKDIPALTHSIAHMDAKAPTCQVDGWEAYDYCTRTECDYTTIVKLTGGEHQYTISFFMGDPTATSGAKGMLSCSTSGCKYNTSELQSFPALSSSEYTKELLPNGKTRYTISVKDENGNTVKASFDI